MFSVVIDMMDNIDIDKARTEGDGMEQSDLPPRTVERNHAKTARATKAGTEEQRKASAKRLSLFHKDGSSVQEKLIVNSNLPLPGLHTLYRRPESVTRNIAPVVPKGELIQLKPRLVSSPTTTSNTLSDPKKTKTPKFVPYEPYPGAVNPLVPTNNSNKVSLVGTLSVNKNNLDINVLASQITTLRTQELSDTQQQSDQETNVAANEEEMSKLKEELQRVKEERDYYHSQFKFQTNVNAELKNLLVASVGEDLQTRVNLLAEDKLQLARALLDSANHLSTHTEQIDFLASQCEVWRSKFLASSVMVEELARWKADLTHKNQMLHESTKRLLETTHQIREMQLEMLKNLKFLAKIRYLNLPEVDVVSLSAENLNILQQMVLHSGVGVPEGNLNISSTSKDPLCEAEKIGHEALQFVSQPLMATDEAIKALFGQAKKPLVHDHHTEVGEEEQRN